MLIRQISSPGGDGHNEDLVAVFEGDGFTDIVIMDGATSVADRDYIDSELGDPAWFVRRFAQALGPRIAPELSQEASINSALQDVLAQFTAHTAGATVPRYAYPIAAMTWVRAMHSPIGPTLHVYALGDCKLFLAHPDGGVADLDPFINPQEAVLKEALAALSAQDVTDPEARLARLLPMLRARREQQNMDPLPASLCIDPQGPFTARTTTVRAPRGSMLMAMTDGFYRIVDTYRLCSVEELARAFAETGPEPLLQQLRAYEASRAGAGTLAVKSADDASAVTCLFI